MTDNKEFLRDLAAVINKHSKEQASNTPDFILANFLNTCLLAYGLATVELANHMYNQAKEVLEDD